MAATKKTEAKPKNGPIELPALRREVFDAYLWGETPLISHAWSRKALMEMLAKQMGQKVPRFPKNPVEDFLASIYRMPDNNYGFPATAIKKCLVTACTSMQKEISKVAAQQAFFVPGIAGSAPSAFAGLRTPMQLVRVLSTAAPQIREDSVRLNGRTADLRYRAEFSPWAMHVEIIYNASLVSRATVAALLDTAGFAVGLGEWRNEKTGIYGSFRLADPAEQKLIREWEALPSVEPVLPDVDAFVATIREQLERFGEQTESDDVVATLDAVAAARGDGKAAA